MSRGPSAIAKPLIGRMVITETIGLLCIYSAYMKSGSAHATAELSEGEALVLDNYWLAVTYLLFDLVFSHGRLSPQLLYIVDVCEAGAVLQVVSKRTCRSSAGDCSN